MEDTVVWESSEFSVTLSDDLMGIKVLNSRFDGQLAAVLQQSIHNQIQRANRIEVDLSRVKLLDSAGLVGLVTLVRMLDQHRPGERVNLVNMNPALVKLITLSHLDKFFTLLSRG